MAPGLASADRFLDAAPANDVVASTAFDHLDGILRAVWRDEGVHVGGILLSVGSATYRASY